MLLSSESRHVRWLFVGECASLCCGLFCGLLALPFIKFIMWVWVKNLDTRAKYAIESERLFRWDGKVSLPFDENAFQASNNFCVMEDGRRILHAAYAVVGKSLEFYIL